MTYLKVPLEDMNLLKRVIANLIEISNLDKEIFYAKANVADSSNTFVEYLEHSQTYYSGMNNMYISLIESRRLAKCSIELAGKIYEEISE